MNQKLFAESLLQNLQYSRQISQNTWQITKDIPPNMAETEAAVYFASAIEPLFDSQFSNINFSVCYDHIRIGWNEERKCMVAGVMICELPK